MIADDGRGAGGDFNHPGIDKDHKGACGVHVVGGRVECVGGRVRGLRCTLAHTQDQGLIGSCTCTCTCPLALIHNACTPARVQIRPPNTQTWWPTGTSTAAWATRSVTSQTTATTSSQPAGHR
jgi:hypothetical protein